MGKEPVFVGVRLPPDVVEQIDKIADREGNPRAAVLRRILVKLFRETGLEGLS